MKQSGGGWGSGGKKGAISVTFDNLGDVAEIELGIPPVLGPGGRHLTVECLPEFLKIVEGTPITYFIEGWNADAQPDEVRAVRDAGHEIGLHAWRHENWGAVPDDRRRELLDKGMTAFDRLGIVPRGFRAPGGQMPVGADDELADIGLVYSSPLGPVGGSRVNGRIVDLPFAWKHVDAYLMHPDLGALRAKFGDQEAPFPVSHWERLLSEAIATAKDEGKHVTLIFHPFLFFRDDRMREALTSFLAAIRADPDLWVASCGDVADWLRSRG